MRFYSRKKPQKKTEMLIERISTGKCDDLVVSELKVAASESDDPAEMEGVVTGLLDIALKSGNPVSVAYAIKTLLAFRPLTAGLEDDLENRAREMALNPGFLATKPLQEALAELLYIRVSERAECARPFIGMLVRFLDERTGRVGTVAYNTLMIVAANQPEYFDGQTAPLVRMLGSINKVTRIETSKIIAVLSLSHPEYVADAEKILLHISSFNPDGELKNAASEAHQILSGRLHPDEKRPYDDSARRNRYKEEQSGGLAEIMRSKMGNDKKVTYDSRIDKRLLSLATNFARKADRAYKIDGESQAAYEENETAAMSRVIDDFSEIAESIKAEAGPAEAPATQVAADGGDTPEEAELRLMMEKVQDDFSITAGSILDAIGMGHLAKKAMMDDVKPAHKEVSAPERPKRARRPDLIWTTHVPEKPPVKEVEEEISPKEFIASIESIINDIDNPARNATGHGYSTCYTSDGSSRHRTRAKRSRPDARERRFTAGRHCRETAGKESGRGREAGEADTGRTHGGAGETRQAAHCARGRQDLCDEVQVRRPVEVEEARSGQDFDQAAHQAAEQAAC